MLDSAATSAVETTTPVAEATQTASPSKAPRPSSRPSTRKASQSGAQRVAKASSTKPSTKASSNGAASTLSGPQYRTLVALATMQKKGPLSRKQIMELGFGGNSVNLKPILEGLLGAKLVREQEVDVDGHTEHLFGLTAAGAKAAAKAPPARAARSAAQHQSLPKVGATFTKEYKGKTYTIKVAADGFLVGTKKYSSLSAAAKGIRGSDTEVNGWAFFGLTK